MTREERIKHIEELETELNLLEKEEIVKHNIYYDKKMQLHRELMFAKTYGTIVIY